MSQYSSQLRDPRWQKKRLEILEHYKWMCLECFSESKELHVHHLIYKQGRKPWEYDEKELIVLCDKCHDEFHSTELALKEIIIHSVFNSGLGPVSAIKHIGGMMACFAGIEKHSGNSKTYIDGWNRYHVGSLAISSAIEASYE
jgi:hypothetical protein